MHIGNQFSHFSPHFDSGHRAGGGFGFGAARGPQGFGPPGQLQKQSGEGGGGLLGAIAKTVLGHVFGKDSFSPGKPAGTPGAPAAPGAQAPGAPGVQGGAKGDGVPYISQDNPAGATANYQNGEQNCGPAVMAMIAREKGLGKGMSDADLITSLGKAGQTDANGTTGNGLIAMAEEMGLKTAAEPGANSQWVMSQLAQGKDVVANGDYYALPQHANANETSPHYILLTGIDAQGNITVEDPADPKVTSITPGQLDQFNAAHPGGGFNLSIG